MASGASYYSPIHAKNHTASHDQGGTDALTLFDATVPVTQAFSDAAATGAATVAARRDHVHGMPAAPTGVTLLQTQVFS